MNPRHVIERRHFSRAFVALGASGLLAPATRPTFAMNHTTPASLIAAAFEYAFPPYEMARTRWNALANPANPARGKANVVAHRRALSDHRARAVTTPNNDTLYSSCWLDLSAGPVRVRVASMPAERYWSVALMDAFSNHFAILGSRLDGRGPVDVHLVAAAWRGARPAGRVIEALGQDVWLLGRWFVEGAHDLAAARAMQDSLQVEAMADVLDATATSTERPQPTTSTDPGNFLAVVNAMLARNPPPPAELAQVASYTACGISAGNASAWGALPAAMQDLWRERIGPLHAALREGFSRGARHVQGWRLPHPAIGDFGSEYALRAAVALGGLAALPTIEAVYFSRETDAAGTPLAGDARYRVRIDAGSLHNDAFWSLSVYERLPDGRMYFTENPIGRYAVSERTPGLQRSADGSIELWLQREPPSEPAQRPNWLPAPAGPLQLTLRAYLPHPELREGRAAMPALERLP